MLKPGTLLEGKYRILEEIGRGGMSTVYLARNERANKTWAVKEIRRASGPDSELLQRRLLAETEMLKKLHHPHLPDIVDVIETEGSLLIVMEYIQGRDLQKIMNEEGEQNPENRGAQDPEAVRSWAIQLCDVLHYLHTRTPPIIYRDLKPANIMLQEEENDRFPYGSVCLIDFGTAREMKAKGTGDTISLGTRGYAAPEQFGGQEESDERTDIYNLGATMYHLLTGYSPAQTNYTFLPVGELRLELKDRGLEKIVAKCCEGLRENRYQSAEELRFDLENESLLCGPAIRQNRRRWRSFLASVFLTAAAAAVVLLSGLYRLHVRGMTYEACLRRAESAETVQDGREAYLNAVSLAPRKPEAYRSLISAIEADNLFSSEERSTLEDCLNGTTDGYAFPNVEELRRSLPAEYDRLMYRIGTDYFFYYENDDGYLYAARKLQNVRKDQNLDLDKNEPAIRGCLFLIADFCAKRRENIPDKSWISSRNAADLWQALTMYTKTPEEAVSRCGTRRIATAMYRELARQIAEGADLYMDAGVEESEMLTALSAAREYVDKYAAASSDTEADRELLRETSQAIDAARFRAETLFYKTYEAEDDHF
ncbi:MAG: serine/threonine-protein kinase [Eubacteriales bacterium]|nr:serine/threonine-protein kinase [Eubacteriales bacterium]